MQSIYRSIMATPVGPLCLAFDKEARLVGMAFDALPKGLRQVPSVDRPQIRRAADLVKEQLVAYLAGELTGFDLPLDFIGGSVFQQSVWRQIMAIPYGALTTYSRLAAAVGKPKAARAVGTATGSNYISIIIPCHRVVSESLYNGWQKNGRLTSVGNYGGNPARKGYLLTIEGVVVD